MEWLFQRISTIKVVSNILKYGSAVRIRPVSPNDYLVEIRSSLTGTWMLWESSSTEAKALVEAQKVKDLLKEQADEKERLLKFVESNPPYEV